MTNIFKSNSVPLRMTINGTVNGTKFVITGEGVGDSRTGKLRGKWVCNERDGCPMSWAALQTTFGYGYRVYTHYPDNMVHWFQECMPEGYTQKRVIRYSRINGSDSIDEEGTMTTFHTVRLEKEMVYGKESWICTNNVVLSANFKAGSPLLQNEALTFSHPSSLEKCMPDGNGLKNYCQFFYPLTDSSGDVVIANQITENRPLFLGKSVPLPPPHWRKVEARQTKEMGDNSHHIIQEEVNKAIAFEMSEGWKEIAIPDITEKNGLSEKSIKSITPSTFKEQSLPLKMKIDGTVNGKKMTILGQGAGDARNGQLKGKWICTEPDVCPLSWELLHPTLGYGYRVFGQYPDHVVQFYQQCMPEGYTQDRTTRFTRMRGSEVIGEEGTMKTTQKIQVKAGLINGIAGFYVDNPTTLKADIKEGSVVLQNGKLIMENPSSIEKVMPFGDGLKCYVQFCYRIKDSDDVMVATQITENHPISSEKSVPLPPPHYRKVDCKQFKDSNEKKDHIIQDELNLFCDFPEKSV